MTQHDDYLYLDQMREAARRVVAHVQTVDRAAFDQNDLYQQGIAHYIQIIGEAARQVSAHGKKRWSHIPWADTIGMRHKIVHDYLAVNFDIIWETARDDLPPLIEALTAILDSEGPQL